MTGFYLKEIAAAFEFIASHLSSLAAEYDSDCRCPTIDISASGLFSYRDSPKLIAHLLNEINKAKLNISPNHHFRVISYPDLLVFIEKTRRIVSQVGSAIAYATDSKNLSPPRELRHYMTTCGKSAHDDIHADLLAWADRLKAEANIPSANPASGIEAASPPNIAISEPLIDLDQAAALVNRSKRTLERAQTDSTKKMPLPEIQGASGKKSEWKYSVIKPWLESEYSRKLPDVPPHINR